MRLSFHLDGKDLANIRAGDLLRVTERAITFLSDGLYMVDLEVDVLPVPQTRPNTSDLDRISEIMDEALKR